MSTMRKIFLILIVFALAFIIRQDSISDTQRPAAIIITITGKIEIKPQNPATWKIATIGMQLFVGDEIRSGEFGKAGIRFVDGTELKISPYTHLVVKLQEKDKKERPASSLKMNEGDIWSKVKKGNTTFQIETPTAIAAVKGTTLGLNVEGQTGDTTLIVYEGMVELANELGKVVAKEAEMAKAKVNEKPTEPEKVDTTKTQEWTQTMEAKANLKINLNPSTPVNQPFNVAISVVDKAGQTDTSRKDNVAITSSSGTLLFSTDQQNWAANLSVALSGGFASFFARDTIIESATISATSAELSPATQGVSILPETKVTGKDLIIKLKTKKGEKTIILKYRKQ